MSTSPPTEGHGPFLAARRSAGKTPARFTYDRIMPEMLRAVRRGSARLDVLDAGCGSGHYADWFPGDRYTGIDLGDNLPASDGRRTFLKGSVQEIPLADASFDLAFCSLVLEHVTDPPAVFRELRRVLRPEGILVLSTASKWTKGLGEMPHWFWRLDREEEGGAFHYFSPSDLVAACRAAGFPQAEARYIGGFFGLALEYVRTFLTFTVYRLAGQAYSHKRDSKAVHGVGKSPRAGRVGAAVMATWRVLTFVPFLAGNWITHGLDRMLRLGPAKVVAVVAWNGK